MWAGGPSGRYGALRPIRMVNVNVNVMFEGIRTPGTIGVEVRKTVICSFLGLRILCRKLFNIHMLV